MAKWKKPYRTQNRLTFKPVTLAQTFRPALILLDIMMPGINGYETCQRLRALPSLCHTKIVMVSAKAMVSERLQGYNSGADDYITKPFNLDELQAKVRVYLRLTSLEEVDQLKSDVLTLLSHETATPLNGVLLPLQLLRESQEIEHEERIELLDMIAQSANRLHTLYSQVRTFSTLLAGQDALQFETTDLREIIQQVIHTVTPRATAHNVQIDVTLTENTVTQLDRQQIHHVVMALLDNAVRVCQAMGRVTINLRHDQEHLCLSVTDEGPGIAPEFLPRLFEPFVQPDLGHHTEGLGLSLAIVYKVIEAHEGTIEVVSELGKGTTFFVRLPIVVSSHPNHHTVADDTTTDSLSA